MVLHDGFKIGFDRQVHEVGRFEPRICSTDPFIPYKSMKGVIVFFMIIYNDILTIHRYGDDTDGNGIWLAFW